MVAEVCAKLGVPHRTLLADWPEPPETNVQAAARTMRYRRLNEWAMERGLKAVATAHHADDQAETLLMRLLRGSGVGGLGGTRYGPGGGIRLELASVAHFTLGYAWNVNGGPGEGRGNVFFTIGIRDLFH